jgi:hypothetical protein
MKKVSTMLLLLLLAVSSYGAYQVGDVVDNFSWEDSNLDDGGNIVVTERNIYDIIDGGKVILIDFGFTG